MKYHDLRSFHLTSALILGLSSINLATCPHPCIVINKDFPDPSFIRPNNGSFMYYAFATMASSDNFVQLATSSDFYHWEVLDLNPIPEGLGGRLMISGGLLMLIRGKTASMRTAQVAAAKKHHCVGTAVADEPRGPYIPLPEPFACDLSIGGTIDASSFVDSDGSSYVLYKVDGNSIGNGGDCGNSIPPLVPTPILLQKVEADGTTAIGEPVEILDRDDSDGPLIEAPSLILKEGVYYLFYSSHCFTSPEYDIRYATSKSLTSPFTKAEKPLLITGDWGLNGPGGATVSGDGESVMFHANCAVGRCSFVGKLDYDGTVVSVV